MSWIRLKGVNKSFDDRPVLREANFRLSKGDKVGLIGRNGAGKTTLLELILDRDTPDSGTIDITDGIEIGYFSQFSELSGTASVVEELTALFSEVHETEAELAEIAEQIGQSPDDKEMARLIDRQGELFETMQRCGGWTYQNDIDIVLTRLGFDDTMRRLPTDQLSGGWRNRSALAKIVIQTPDVLLMDEPTNYLDLEGVSWLEGWFNNFGGALIVVSHDRHFLDNVTNRIASRREAAKNPSQALKRRLANIKKSGTPRPVDQIITDIYSDLVVRKDLCEIDNLSKVFGERALFSDLAFTIHKRDRIAVTGPNGCGKTTLVEIIAQRQKPSAGTVTWAKGPGFIHFNDLLESLDETDTVTHAVNATGVDTLSRTATRKSVNRFLTLMQFSEMDLRQRISTLSGGQRARVALAQCLLSGASTIILDEPTNHMDITSMQVMERALNHFPGAVIVVSHDRFFIQNVATRVFQFSGAGEVRETRNVWSV
jgi:ATP-binding cassette subfamily F protein 3